jgi:hypothetical protein
MNGLSIGAPAPWASSNRRGASAGPSIRPENAVVLMRALDTNLLVHADPLLTQLLH